MKKFCFLLTVLLSLALCSSALAEDAASLGNNYCRIDDYGCYVYNEDSQQSYIMFWSEAGRKSIMGDMTAPYENVVAKPDDSGSRLPLLSSPGSGSKVYVVTAANCMDVMAYASVCESSNGCTGMTVSACKDMFVNTYSFTGPQCMDLLFSSTMKACSECLYPLYLAKMEQGVPPSGTLSTEFNAQCTSICSAD